MSLASECATYGYVCIRRREKKKLHNPPTTLPSYILLGFVGGSDAAFLVDDDVVGSHGGRGSIERVSAVAIERLRRIVAHAHAFRLQFHLKAAANSYLVLVLIAGLAVRW